MRNQILSLLLISSFVFGSFPALAQEVPPPTEPAETPTETETPVIETPSVIDDEPAPIETPPVIENPAPPVIETPPEESFVPQSSENMALLDDPTIATWDLDTSINLPNGCTITDSDGVVHIFPVATSTEYLAACALVEAVENGTISEFTVANASFGLYVTSIDGTSAASDEYWSLWLNNDYASCGIGCLPLEAGDSVEFVRTSFEGVESDRLSISVTTLVDTYDNIVLSDTCSITDSGGVVHTYPEGDDTEYLAACALVAAQEQGYISSFVANDASFGLYLTSVDGVDAAADEYWSLWLNNDYASCGIECLPLEREDVFSLVRTSFEGVESTRFDLRILSLVETPDAGPGDGSGNPGDSDTFDVPAAYTFLAAAQDEDGSWDSDYVTDWAAFAAAAPGAPQDMKSSLTNYLREEEPDFSSPCEMCDYERHAMALMALNINPYTGGPEDYITPIVESFDGTQIDSPGLVNDDIFALIPLLHAGYDEDDEMIQKITAFIILKQESGGSWGDIDMTGAAIQALSSVRSLPGVSAAISDGEDFLRDSQQTDGGFYNPSSTSWAIQGILALGQSAEDWTVGENTPLTYLASVQDEEGGITAPNTDREWATAYAIPAVKGLTWDDVMRNFKKPKVDESSKSKKEEEVVVVPEEEVVPLVEEPLVPELYVEPAPVVATTDEQSADNTVEESVTEQSDEPTEEVAVAGDPSPALAAAAAATVAIELIKKIFSSLWSSFRSLF